jgi:hypothetical protein
VAPDLVHVHSFTHFGVGIGELCAARSVPMVVTCHDLWVTCARYFRLPVPGVTCPSGTDRTPCVPCVNTFLLEYEHLVVAGLAERDRLLRAEFATARGGDDAECHRGARSCATACPTRGRST